MLTGHKYAVVTIHDPRARITPCDEESCSEEMKQGLKSEYFSFAFSNYTYVLAVPLEKIKILILIKVKQTEVYT